MLATSVTLPLEMLKAAWEMAKTQRAKLPPLSISYRSESGKPVLTHTGLTLAADPLDIDVPQEPLIFLPALWRNPLKVVDRQPQLRQWLDEQLKAQNTTIAAVGTGVCLLAEIGVLDGKPATTHWHYFESFSQRYPKVQLKRDLFITRHQRIFCTASINALAELTAFFIKEQYGLRIAQAVERNFFHEIRQSRTQAGLSALSPATTDELVALAISNLDDQLDQSIRSETVQTISINALAHKLDVSVRSLNRHFQRTLNLSPLQYIQNKRMTIAEDLLRTSNLTITEIANLSGFQDPQHFSRLFKKLYNVSPRQYRMTVRSKLFT